VTRQLPQALFQDNKGRRGEMAILELCDVIF
jgi:hypothetical protein